MRATEVLIEGGIEVEQEGGVLTVCFARPERKNALTLDGYHTIGRVFRAVNDDLSVNLVVLTGAGDAFCSGGDTQGISQVLATQTVEERLRFTRMTGQTTKSIRDCEVPVIAVMRGPAAGAGGVLAMAADVRVMAEDSYFQFLFNRLGLTGADMGAAYLLGNLVGTGRALELLLTGRRIPALEALRIGLAHQVIPEEDWKSTVDDMIEQWSSWPRTATTTTKRALAMQTDLNETAAYEIDAYMQTVCLSTETFLSKMR
jgi:enoyl-CoA hydratase/carnithine racemase